MKDIRFCCERASIIKFDVHMNGDNKAFSNAERVSMYVNKTLCHSLGPSKTLGFGSQDKYPAIHPGLVHSILVEITF